MADVEFGTEFPELHLLTVEEATIDGETFEFVLLDENVIASRFMVVLPESKRRIDNMARISTRDPFYNSNKPWLEYMDADCPFTNYTPRWHSQVILPHGRSRRSWPWNGGRRVRVDCCHPRSEARILSQASGMGKF